MPSDRPRSRRPWLSLGGPFFRLPPAWRGSLRLVLDAVLPPRCLCCGALVAEPGALCATCFAAATFITPPVCHRCGSPFPEALDETSRWDGGPPMRRNESASPLVCDSCRRRPPVYARARSVLVYDDHSRPLILAFKHADRTDAARPLAAWMARVGAPLLASADLIVPVPLHRWRLWRRRYNQAALLAKALAARSGVPWDPLVLTRLRATPSQEGLGRRARAANVTGAFHVNRGTAVRGRRILLIDDVLTTGATVEECARALRAAGADAVDVLTLARVVTPMALQHQGTD